MRSLKDRIARQMWEADGKPDSHGVGEVSLASYQMWAGLALKAIDALEMKVSPNQTDVDRVAPVSLADVIDPPPEFDRDVHWSVMRALTGGFRNVWRDAKHEFDEDTALFLAGVALDALPIGAIVVGPWGSGKHFEQRDCLTAADVARIIAGLPDDMPLAIARQELSEGVARLARMAREAEAR